MDFFTHAAEWFIGLFRAGGETFISWMTGIVPLVLMLLIAMNSLIQMIGEDRINAVARRAAGNPVSRYLILPFLGFFMLANPMGFTLGRFLPEKYKPSFYASGAQFCHTSSGIFPHINAGELFIWLGIAKGVEQLGLSSAELAIRYLIVGLVLNFLGGWVTDFITPWVAKQQGVTLSSEVKVSA
ncbi:MULTISPECIES: PTS glucitol/sorbitol transporter subunit IIC [unclassified Luteococcus]|uniref:PTS glucitol/sorbitol transporter subunit IIC n=1 Tax=unclassified Luteococcus TaxID=2639923 RepID=UPI00313DA1B3